MLLSFSVLVTPSSFLSSFFPSLSPSSPLLPPSPPFLPSALFLPHFLPPSLPPLLPSSLSFSPILSPSLLISPLPPLVPNRVMGTSVNLKNRFAGYKVEVIVTANSVPQMMDIVREKLPGTAQTTTTATTLIKSLFLLGAVPKSEPIEIEGGGVLLPYSLPPDR